MINRYRSRRVARNDQQSYKNVFKNRNVKFIDHFTSPSFTYMNAEQYANLQIAYHVWGEGDRYYKLAEKYYGNPEDWWIIAKFNQKPTESHIKVGDIISVPTPLDLVLEYMLG